MKWQSIMSLGIEVAKHGGNGQVFVRSLKTGKELSVRNGFMQLYNPDTGRRKSYSVHRLWAHTQGFPYRQVELSGTETGKDRAEGQSREERIETLFDKYLSYLENLLAPESLIPVKPHTALQIARFLASYAGKEKEKYNPQDDEPSEEEKEYLRHILDEPLTDKTNL